MNLLFGFGFTITGKTFHIFVMDTADPHKHDWLCKRKNIHAYQSWHEPWTIERIERRITRMNRLCKQCRRAIQNYRNPLQRMSEI